MAVKSSPMLVPCVSDISSKSSPTRSGVAPWATMTLSPSSTYTYSSLSWNNMLSVSWMAIRVLSASASNAMMAFSTISCATCFLNSSCTKPWSAETDGRPNTKAVPVTATTISCILFDAQTQFPLSNICTISLSYINQWKFVACTFRRNTNLPKVSSTMRCRSSRHIEIPRSRHVLIHVRYVAPPHVVLTG